MFSIDWGEKENQDLMNRFGVKQADYPVFKLFIKGKDLVTFNGDVTENRLLTFTQENTGFWFGKYGLKGKYFLANGILQANVMSGTKS